MTILYWTFEWCWNPVKQKLVTYKLCAWESSNQVQKKIWKKNPQEESKLKFNDELQQLNIGHISYLSKSHIQTIISAEGWI